MILKDHLRSKITVPQVSHILLQRKNIAAVINNTIPEAAVCFVAPYGYGKTLSVVSWLRDNRQDAVWLSLDADDNSEQVFFTSLSAAMLRVTGWQGDANDILSDLKHIKNPQEYLWETVSTAEKSGCDKILVMDNFQFIRENGLLRFVRDIISDLLGRWRVVIMSRAEMPTVFAGLMLKGNICLITPKELSFSPEEMAEFFTMNGCLASEEDIFRVRNETEGWPAALNVVSMISRGGAIDYGEAARGYMSDFFEAEIWNGLNENVRIFLLKTSVLSKLTPAGCRAVMDTGETLPILQWLFIRGLFISKLDEKDTYRYHRVFQDFLLDKLVRSDVDEQELYRRQGWWLFDNGEIAQSFPCFYKAGDLYGISQVQELILPSDMDSLEEYLELMLPITDLDTALLKPYPVIVARMAQIQFLMGNLDQMHSLHRLLCEWDESGTLSLTTDEYAVFLWEVGWLYILDPDENSKENERHRKWLDLLHSLPFLQELHMSRSAILYFPTMLKGIRDYGDDGLFQTEELMTRIEAGEKDIVDDTVSQWLSYLLLAEYHYERERFAEAEGIVRRMMPLAEEHQLTFMYFIGTALLVKIIRVLHNTDEIDVLTKRLEDMIVNNGHRFLLPNFHAFEMRNKLIEGQVGFTEVFEEENRDYEDKPYFYLIYRHFTLARGLMSLGNHNKAMLILGNLELLCKKYRRPTDLIEVNILQSVSLYCLGYKDDACDRLIEALTASERFGYIRMFSDDAKGIWPVLALVRKQMSGKYIQQIIISCKKTLVRIEHYPTSKKFSHIELTKTELKVLKAVQNGMSYAEIAQDHGVRMSTIKSQLHSIYSKLGVSNKTEAVITARNTGILE